MGLFDRFKKEKKSKEEPGGVLPSFVLLDEVAFDVDAFVKDLYDDWGIEIPADQIKKATEKADGDLPMLVATLGNATIAVSLMPAPVPDGEAVGNAKTNFRWPEAVAVTECHKACILVAVLPPEEQSLKETAVLHAKLCASVLKQPHATAINTAGTVFDPAFYIDSAEQYVKEGKFPILNHIFFGLYSNDGGGMVSGYTYGLGNLGKKDIEILDSNHSPDEVLDFMTDIALYILEYDAILKHGETIGFSAEQKLAITESAGIAVDGRSLKIEF